MKRTKFGHIKPQCLEAIKKRRKGLQDFMRRYNKIEFSKNTLDFASLWLTSQYNINRYEALAYLAYASMKSKINGYGNVSGQNNVYAYKVFQDILLRYGQELPYDYKRVIDEMHIKVRDISSPEVRQKLLFLEMLAWLQVNRKLRADVTIADRIVDVERRFGGNFVINMWSKPAFWLMANILVFDTLTQRTAPPANAYDLHLSEDGSTLQIEAKNWYDTRKYMTENERWLWRVYDEVIEEIGRELVAAGLTAYGMHRLTRGLRLFSELVLDLATFHPNIKGLKTISEIAKNIARYIDGSVVVFVASQVFIEWKLEAWFAFHEWNFLKDIRDFLAGYTSPAEVFTQEEFTRLKEYLKKIQFEPWALNATQRDELNQMLELAKYHGLSDILDWYRYATFMFERMQWLVSMGRASDYLKDRLLREDEFNPAFRERSKEEIEDEIKRLFNEMRDDERVQIDESDIIEKNIPNPASGVFRDYTLPDMKYKKETTKKKHVEDNYERYEVNTKISVLLNSLIMKQSYYDDRKRLWDISGDYVSYGGSFGRIYERYCSLGLGYFINIPSSHINTTLSFQIPCENQDSIKVTIPYDDNLEVEHEYNLKENHQIFSNIGSHAFVLAGGDIATDRADIREDYIVHEATTKYKFNSIPEYVIIPFRVNVLKPYLFMTDGKRCVGWKKAKTKIIKKAIKLPIISGKSFYQRIKETYYSISPASDLESCTGKNLDYQGGIPLPCKNYDCHLDCTLSWGHLPTWITKKGIKKRNTHSKETENIISYSGNTVTITHKDTVRMSFLFSTGYSDRRVTYENGFQENYRATYCSLGYKRGFISNLIIIYNNIVPGSKTLPVVDLTNCRLNKRAKLICL